MIHKQNLTHSGKNLLLKTFLLHAPCTELKTVHLVELCAIEDASSHGDRVGAYSAEIYEAWAQKSGAFPETIAPRKHTLRIAATLHDIGKTAIADGLLNKAGRLTDEEFEIVKRHTIFGARLFTNLPSELHQATAQVALNHHERWDGSGYPGHIDLENGVSIRGKSSGKQGRDIPLFARIVAIADVFDALLSCRSYKAAWKEVDVLRLIEQGAGKHFDPGIVDAFFVCLSRIRQLAQGFFKRMSGNVAVSPGIQNSHTRFSRVLSKFFHFWGTKFHSAFFV